MQAYCMKCRAKREMKNASAITMRSTESSGLELLRLRPILLPKHQSRLPKQRQEHLLKWFKVWRCVMYSALNRILTLYLNMAENRQHEEVYYA